MQTDYDYFAGYMLVIAAGFFQGSFMLPMKFIRRWAWENTWLIFSITAYLVWPWLVAFLTLPHPISILAGTSGRSLGLVGLLGLGWGIGALTFGLGVSAVGIALGITVILGIASTAGTLIPLLVISPEQLRQSKGLLTSAALGLVVAGIAFCSWAGRLRADRPAAAGESQGLGFGTGLAVCVASGLLSACGNLGFAFGGELVQKAIEHGAREAVASNALWAFMTLPLFLFNTAYSLWLLKRHGSTKLFLLAGSHSYWILAPLMGFLWIAGFLCYGSGARRLGSLGPSAGWAIMISTMILTANLWGLLTGEWKQAGRRAYGLLTCGVVLLVLAVSLVGYANRA